MSSTPSSPAGTGEDRSAVLLGTSLSFGITATLIVILRIGYRTSRRVISASDWCIMIAAAINFTHMVLDVDSVVHWGYGRHESDLPPNIRNAPEGLLYFWLAQVLTKPSLLFTKLSLFFVYLSLFKKADTLLIRCCRGLNYFTAFLVVGYYGAALLVTIFQCRPVDKSWHAEKPGTCIDKSFFFYSTGIANVITSVLVITIPLPVLLRTKYRTTEVTQLLALVLLGIIDTATSIVRMFTLATAAASKVDLTWTLVNSTTATAIEMSVAIIAASLVVMRPCFQAIHRTFFPNSHPHKTLSGNNPSGYITSRNDTKSQTKSKDRETVITKTVEIELSSRSISTEDILRSKDRF